MDQPPSQQPNEQITSKEAIDTWPAIAGNVAGSHLLLHGRSLASEYSVWRDPRTNHGP
ncbi:hypothetical protein J6590_071421 [Homalodisca vitripennis]|nr:hypothetical protein J6590_071421 [Homalodisca vitripennis]